MDQTMDQAGKLRDLVKKREAAQPAEPARPLQARVITITSGKGGVGKSNLALNMALQMSRLGKKVVVIDADLGLANIEVLLGLIPRYSFADVLTGGKTMEEALTNGPLDIRFLSGGSGLVSLANVSDKQMGVVLNTFDYLDRVADVIHIDTGAGIARPVVNFIKASRETIVITTPEPTSITDAYAVIKTIKEEKSAMPEFKIVVNRVDDYREGIEIFDKLNKVTQRFLQVELQYLGTIPYDANLVKSVKKQQPVAISYPASGAAKSIENISLRLLNAERRQEKPEGFRTFVNRLVHVFRTN